MIFRNQYEFDKRYVNVTITTFNDRIHNTVANITVELYQPIDNVFIAAELRLPESQGDRSYGKMYFRTRLDAKKLLKGVRGHMLISLFFDLITESMDFEPKFPADKVSKLRFTLTLTKIFFLFSIHRKCTDLSTSPFQQTLCRSNFRNV